MKEDNVTIMESKGYHCPVLLKESVDYLVTNVDGTYVDLTFGGGGHTKEILSRLSPKGRVLVFDLDKEAIANCPSDERVVFVNQNYRYLWNYLRYYDAIPVDGILGDLGISSHQIDCDERGFAIRKDGNLDMRMNNRSGKSAKDVLNTYSEDELMKVFREYGEIDKPYYLVRDIVAYRDNKLFETTNDLKQVAEKSAPRNKEFKYLSQVFQAIRIEVNQELKSLEEMLMQLSMVLKADGRVVIISYHSLEDRLVKNLFKTGNIEGDEKKDFYGNKLTPFEVLTRKPVVPSDEEIAMNGRARSAKMRIAKKL